MKRRRRTRGTFEQTAAPLLFLGPNLIIFSLFIIVPAVMGLRMSFFDWSILGGSHYVGLRNFTRLFGDAMFWKTMANTFVYVAAVVPLLLIFALGLAVLLSRPGRIMGIFRSLYYLPTLLSLIIVGIAWRWILGFDLGILNYLLKVAGMKPIPWLTNGEMAMSSLIFVTVWTRVGYFMMMLVGGLQAIPETFYEAARIDGADRGTVFRRITLPLLRPMLLVVAVLATIESFKAYELIFVMTQGGPGSATKFLVQYIYQVAFEEDRLGYGSAMSVVLLVIIGLFTFIQFVARREEYSNE
ncbi:MAG TPA: sugar ABC transporter permease [Rectinemataceae bacterium]|nr:sugar ABC transporter permease [Rectinemataceae bacterium]